ncbi:MULTISPECIES: hypothetical protein [Clostridium]|uniref:Uncharacterized protein n=1 Tax=Clostridium frigoriphilum TaxID=443253 RepID=A0ABU7UVP2_9CLOT|nr:hypothetical protein [Clostridium sp. DSM 17811]MBU3102465.1 hypothetical protein [Clostridium sp. DSM 17811]
MVILDNYSKKLTCIKLNTILVSYSICNYDEIGFLRDGEGGFSEKGDLLGLYIKNEKLFFLYNSKIYEVNSDSIQCKNKYTDDKKRCFKVEIDGDLVCDISYVPFIDPQALVFDSDEDEFDFLLHLSEILKSKTNILEFIMGIKNLNEYYQSIS